MAVRASRRATLLLVIVAVLTTVLVVGFVACAVPQLSSHGGGVQGQGEVVSEDRTTAPFRGITVGDGIRVIVGTGGETSVTLAAQQNLLALITTEVTDDELVVDVAPPGISTTEPILLTIRVPELDSIVLKTGATGTLEDVGGPLAVDVSAGATIIAIGEVPSLDVGASEGAVAKLGELVAGTADVALTTGSTVEVHVTGAVTGTADAGSTLVLTHKPGSVDVKATGGATVTGG